MNLYISHILEFYRSLILSNFPTFYILSSWLKVCIFRLGIKNAAKEHVTALKGIYLSKSNSFEERKCYHTHSSPNVTIYCAVLCSTKYIDSFGENGDFWFKMQNLHFSDLFLDLYTGLFVEIFVLWARGYSMKIENVKKEPFDKSVRNV